jgi:hypothetical protein
MSDEEDDEQKQEYSAIWSCFQWLLFIIGTPARRAEAKTQMRSEIMKMDVEIQNIQNEINRCSASKHQNILVLNGILEKYIDQPRRIAIGDKQRQKQCRQNSKSNNERIAQLEKELRIAKDRRDRWTNILHYDSATEQELSLEKLASQAGLKIKDITKKQEKAEKAMEERAKLTTAMNARFTVNSEETEEIGYDSEEELEEEKVFMEEFKKISKIEEARAVRERLMRAESELEHGENYSIDIKEPAINATPQREIDEFNPQ